jgi:hypothetical protein
LSIKELLLVSTKVDALTVVAEKIVAVKKAKLRESRQKLSLMGIILIYLNCDHFIPFSSQLITVKEAQENGHGTSQR